MNYLYHDLGYLGSGATIHVELSGSAANVRLMDVANFQRYKAGKQYRYWGGHARRSPVVLQTPRSGHWCVVVDLGGYAGRIESAVSVIS